MGSDDEGGAPLAAISQSLRRDYPDLEDTLTTSGTAILLTRLGIAAICLASALFLFLDPILGIASFYLCCILSAMGGTETFIRAGQLRHLRRPGRAAKP